MHRPERFAYLSVRFLGEVKGLPERAGRKKAFLPVPKARWILAVEEKQTASKRCLSWSRGNHRSICPFHGPAGAGFLYLDDGKHLREEESFRRSGDRTIVRTGSFVETKRKTGKVLNAITPDRATRI